MKYLANEMSVQCVQAKPVSNSPFNHIFRKLVSTSNKDDRKQWWGEMCPKAIGRYLLIKTLLELT